MTSARYDVTVVTPTLDVDETDLHRCVTSIATQSAVRVQHIVVDGGSESRVLALARQGGAQVISAPGTSQSEAIMVGAAAGTGDWISWLGADDSLQPGGLARSLDALRRSGADWSYGPCEQVFPDHVEIFQPPRTLDARTLGWGNAVAQPGALVSATAWNAVGGVSADLHYAMDADLWARLLTGGYTPVRLDRPVATFVIHPKSKSGSDNAARFLLEEHRAWSAVGWTVPASVVLGRARWHEVGPAAFSGAGSDGVAPVDERLARRAARVEALLEAWRAGTPAPPATVGADLLLSDPCRRRLARAARNALNARVGHPSRY